MKYLKTFESINEIVYSVSEKELLEHGYTSDLDSQYKSYHKNIDKIDIRCWSNTYSKSKNMIYIKDLQEHSSNVINYYMKHIYEDGNIKTGKMFKDYNYFPVKINFETGEIIKKYDLVLELGVENYLNSKYEISGEWETVVFIPETWDKIIEELVFLTEGGIKKNSNYKIWEMKKNSNKYNL